MTNIPEIIQLRVTTRASSNSIKIEKQADGTTLYRIYVTVIPENGKANDAVIKLLSKHFGLSKSSFEIIQGQTNRNKTIRVNK